MNLYGNKGRKMIMEKDDYDVIVYKVLLYYYACLKRQIFFDKAVFFQMIDKDNINDEYFTDILLMMQDDGLIKGIRVTKAWGGDSILLSDLDEIKITTDGIHYLKENSTMNKVKNVLLKTVDMTSKLIGIMKLI